MPCWYFDKRELQKTPSYNDGINAETEAKYRREGARFIMDAGSKMKLHYNTCATGVVYFHRFFLFHSFKEFHRHVMAACCLFLAGKVEETPKKCRDLIKITQSMLSEEEFAAFGKDPREEVMTLERILLQTIKFDLMVEHPYAYVVKFAKQFKGDKSKLEKMAQMAWTFVNDSLCTTLCLQWEAEVIAVAMMYLTSRLSKFEPLDWHGRPSGFRGKWYEFLVKDVTLELLEDICHQVLDLYSKPHLKSDTSAPHQSNPPLPPSDDSTKSTPKTPCSPQVAKKSGQGSSQSSSRHSEADSSTHSSGSRSKPSSSAASAAAGGPAAAAGGPAAAAGGPAVPPSNPYPSAQTSFMSGEGKQSIQSLISGDMSAGSSFQRSGQPVPPYNQFQVGPYNQNFPPPLPGTMPYGYDMRSQQYHGTAMQVDPPAPPANGDRQPHWQ